ncbi:MAG TPA: elongation factor G [Desulfobacter postgatei]|jgi:elongation factor G|uniref:elongation factor G n=1 Tax=Desulfobacter sp. TaxID=2294 RepID=UPI000E8BF44D|nr:elongation factor G [Desulfobacter sp.]MDQ1269561.1 elongation factor [Thermodesulfobacteriota bacterium]HBT89733.1 elongation factor G [Desulfobacter sp.]HRF89270.1 elongation factor G [Desulfobacter postgatei]
MSEEIKSMRNVAFAGHGGAGKTTLAEAMLFKAGVTNRLGKVEDGNTVMDFQPEEIKKQQSINTSFIKYTHQKHVVTLMDTPGDQNFFSAAKTCFPVADSMAFVIDGVGGPSAMTEEAAASALEYNLPGFVIINKLDRERSDFTTAVAACDTALKKKIIPVCYPIGKEDGFKGLVNIVSGTAFEYDADGKATRIDIPADMADEIAVAKEEFVENVAELDDDLLEKYLEGEEVTEEEIKRAFRKGVLDAHFYPAICISATKMIGIDVVFDFINDYMPSPLDRGPWIAKDADGNDVEVAPDPDAEFTGFVFATIVDPYAGRLSLFRVISGKLGKEGNIFNATKDNKERFSQLLEIAGKEQKQIDGALPGAIVAVAKLKNTLTGDTLTSGKSIKIPAPAPLPPCISFAISPKSKSDEDKIHEAVRKILEEDTGLTLRREEETRQTILSGRGLVHIEVTAEKIQRKFNVGMDIATPKVAYRETFKKKVRVQGKHKKQSGGHGQYGDCWIELEPLPKGSGYEFVDKIVGGVIPKNYIPAVEAGIRQSMHKGVLAGFPCVDFRTTLDFGSYHAVDSSEMAFKTAGSLAFKNAAAQANAVLLEPIMKVSVKAPDDATGDIMGDLNSRRGRVVGMDSEGDKQIINALVPMSEMLRYAPDLSSMTGGRGSFSMEFEVYDEVPADLAKKIIDQVNAEKEA